MALVSTVICLECGTILHSLYTHDYRTCGCPQDSMIDGGTSYLRCGGFDLDKLEAGLWDTVTNTFDSTRTVDDLKQKPAERVSRWPY